jgi:hypothetical protein
VQQHDSVTNVHGGSRQTVVTGLFGASTCSARTTADSCPNPNWLDSQPY